MTTPETFHAMLSGIVQFYGASLAAKQQDVERAQAALRAAEARIKELETRLAAATST